MDKKFDFDKLVGKRIAYFRKEMNLTQYELAERLNYSDKTISKWELGQSLPSIFILNELANFFNISLDILIGNKAIPKKVKREKNRFRNAFLYSLLVFVIFFIGFAVLHIAFPDIPYISILLIFWGIAAAMIPIFIYSLIFNREIPTYISSTIFIWVLTTSLYLGLNQIEKIENHYILFVVAAPINLLIFFYLFHVFKKRSSKIPKE